MENEIDWAQADGDEVVCHCLGINKRMIVDAIESGAYTLALVKTMTQAGRGKDCKQRHPMQRTCETDIEELIELYNQEPSAMPDSCGGDCGCGCC